MIIWLTLINHQNWGYIQTHPYVHLTLPSLHSVLGLIPFLFVHYCIASKRVDSPWSLHCFCDGFPPNQGANYGRFQTLGRLFSASAFLISLEPTHEYFNRLGKWLVETMVETMVVSQYQTSIAQMAQRYPVISWICCFSGRNGTRWSRMAWCLLWHSPCPIRAIKIPWGSMRD